jgi:hypothetical protein
MTQTIYYTFSTIAQVIAAIVGIIGAFAIFSFQSIKDRLFRLANEICDKTGEGSGFNTSFLKNVIYNRKFENLEKLVSDLYNFFKIQSNQEKENQEKGKGNPNDKSVRVFINIEPLYLDFSNYYRIHSSLCNNLNVVLIYGFSIIIASLLILSFVGYISTCIGYYVLVFSIIAISFYFYMVYKYVKVAID